MPTYSNLTITTMALPRWNAARMLTLAAVVCLGWQKLAEAQYPQAPQTHYLHRASMPPGAIGSRQLLRGGPLVGYYQPVEFTAPSGARISLAVNGQFESPARIKSAGLLIGQVYRLRVTNIPFHEGEEVYPTLEVIDRTYPPAHMAHRFPILVEISHLDLDLALQEKFVTRVIYLEDPRNALPTVHNPREQDWFDTRPGEDPLQVADTLGRPMAILRMGGRIPKDLTRPSMQFLYNCPPFRNLPKRRRAMPNQPQLKLKIPPPAKKE